MALQRGHAWASLALQIGLSRPKVCVLVLRHLSRDAFRSEGIRQSQKRLLHPVAGGLLGTGESKFLDDHNGFGRNFHKGKFAFVGCEVIYGDVDFLSFFQFTQTLGKI